MFYPIFLDLRDKTILVVGGGVIAERKVEGLVDAGARITIVSPEITESLRALAQSAPLTVQLRPFQTSDVDGADLVVTATDDPAVQQTVARAAREKKILINTVDRIELCDFIFPSIVRQGDVTVGISTAGKSPALAAALRRQLEGVITKDVARAVRLMGEIRAEIHALFPLPEKRKEVFESIVGSGLLEWLPSCDDTNALERMRSIAATHKQS